ncbi:hypothetical protein D5S17_18360 [Pseudonocardiaceae bacterium YIM PH 21723]|nr:hypothetical protein D5S17_18360 [Pseudonocardiaceae bacterium YIM PH 21723]
MRNVRNGGLAAIIAASALLLTAAPGMAAAGTTTTTTDPSTYVGAEAYAIKVRASGAGQPIKVGPIAWSKDTGPDENSALDFGTDGFVRAKGITTLAKWDRKSGGQHAEAATTDTRVGVLGPIFGIRVDSTKAYCSSSTKGITGGANIAGVNLGPVPVPVEFPPNTHVGVPGLGEVIFNEQITEANGSLTVNAIHVKALESFPGELAGADVQIASVNCGVAKPPVPLASGAGLLAGLGVVAAIGLPAGAFALRRRLQQSV